MSDLVPVGDIERIVGCRRHPWAHYGRAVSDKQTVYILHSAECLSSGIDLRDCIYSKSLDLGIDQRWWTGYKDQVVLLVCSPLTGKLLPRKDNAYEALS